MTSLIDNLFRPGEIAVMPTDTVYGVVARAQDAAAVARLYKLKHREGKPGTLIAASTQQLVDLGVEQKHLEPVAHYWPNAVSVIMPLGHALGYLHQGKKSLAVRVPANAEIRALLEQTGPLLTSSANQPGEPPARTVDEARAYFGEAVTWYEDGGYIDGPPSTILQVSNGEVTVVRQGAVRTV
jgi:L-threonylcarbamoyladenylate synthase